ncbi:MAG: aldehyde dehydrogenase family protein [bacterium]|nr:aldehyde dehydrogenase family protein [bacterium]
MTLPVAKTYKHYIGGKFPRSESGRAFQPSGNPDINVTRGSRKDLREAVLAARKGLASWSGATSYLRGQILYRIAEMLESRREAMQAELRLGGATAAEARKELDAAIALTVWYAGLSDKLQTLLGSQNEVQGPFFAFSTVEPTGVIGVVAPDGPALTGLLALVLPVLVGGNAVIAVPSASAPFAGLALGEVCASSDVPGGALNIVAGQRAELAPQLAAHRDVDGLFVAGKPDAELTAAGADNLKRTRFCTLPAKDWRDPKLLRALSWVEPFVEVKALWHPVAP